MKTLTQTSVNIREQAAQVVVVVHDDGAGFEITGDTSGFGLAGMREGVAFVDGELEIETRRRHDRPREAACGAAHRSYEIPAVDAR